MLHPTARKIRRRHLEVIVHIECLWGDSAEQRALAVAWLAGPKGVRLADLVRNVGIGPRYASEMLEKLREQGELVALEAGMGQAETLLHAEVIRSVEERLLGTLAQMHQHSPLLPTHDCQKVQAQLADVGNDALVNLAVDRLLQEGRLLGNRDRIARSDFKPKLGSKPPQTERRDCDGLPRCWVAAAQAKGLRGPRWRQRRKTERVVCHLRRRRAPRPY